MESYGEHSESIKHDNEDGLSGLTEQQKEVVDEALECQLMKPSSIIKYFKRKYPSIEEPTVTKINNYKSYKKYKLSKYSADMRRSDQESSATSDIAEESELIVLQDEQEEDEHMISFAS